MKGTGGLRSSQLSGGPEVHCVETAMPSQVYMAQTMCLSHRNKETSKRGAGQRVRSTAQLQHNRSALLCRSDHQQGAHIPCFPEQSNSASTKTQWRCKMESEHMICYPATEFIQSGFTCRRMMKHSLLLMRRCNENACRHSVP